MTHLYSCLLSASLVLGVLGQNPAPPSTPPAAEAPKPQDVPAGLNPEDIPVSLDRLKKAIAQPPAIKLDTEAPVFRTQVIGRNPTIEEILGPDFHKGPVAHGAMTHQDFLNMVTPKDVQGMAAFSTKEALTVAATSFALQWALQRAVQRFRNAADERERESARREVEQALKDLDRAREKAGLPPR